MMLTSSLAEPLSESLQSPFIMPDLAHSSSIFSSSQQRSGIAINVSTDFHRELKSDLHLSAEKSGTLSVPVSWNPVRMPFTCGDWSVVVIKLILEKHTTMAKRTRQLTGIEHWNSSVNFNTFSIAVVKILTSVFENLWYEVLVLALENKSIRCHPTQSSLTSDESGSRR